MKRLFLFLSLLSMVGLQAGADAGEKEKWIWVKPYNAGKPGQPELIPKGISSVVDKFAEEFEQDGPKDACELKLIDSNTLKNILAFYSDHAYKFPEDIKERFNLFHGLHFLDAKDYLQQMYLVWLNQIWSKQYEHQRNDVHHTISVEELFDNIFSDLNAEIGRKSKRFSSGKEVNWGKVLDFTEENKELRELVKIRSFLEERLKAYFSKYVTLDREHVERLTNYENRTHHSVSIKYLVETGQIPQIEEKVSFNCTHYILDLSNKNISSLDGLQKIQNIKSVIRLYLNNNQLKEIKPGPFEGLTELRILDLNNNRLEEIEPGAFTGLTNLRRLELNNNQLEEIEPGAFTGLTNLRTLNLSYNQLKEIKPGAFTGLTQLDALNLSYNQLKEIKPGPFEGLTELRRLELNNNQLERIKAGTFEGLTKLRILDCDNNQLKEIEPGISEVLTRLQSLGLRNNRLEEIEPEAFTDLRESSLSIRDNYLTSQNITEIRERMDSRVILEDEPQKSWF